MSSEEACIICTEAISEHCVLSDCEHTFCFSCIMKWCSVKQECPLCRTRVAWVLDSEGVQHSTAQQLDYPAFPAPGIFVSLLPVLAPYEWFDTDAAVDHALLDTSLDRALRPQRRMHSGEERILQRMRRTRGTLYQK